MAKLLLHRHRAVRPGRAVLVDYAAIERLRGGRAHGRVVLGW